MFFWINMLCFRAIPATWQNQTEKGKKLLPSHPDKLSLYQYHAQQCCIWSSTWINIDMLSLFKVHYIGMKLHATYGFSQVYSGMYVSLNKYNVAFHYCKNCLYHPHSFILFPYSLATTDISVLSWEFHTLGTIEYSYLSHRLFIFI